MPGALTPSLLAGLRSSPWLFPQNAGRGPLLFADENHEWGEWTGAHYPPIRYTAQAAGQAKVWNSSEDVSAKAESKTVSL